MITAQLQFISETFLGESPKYLLNAALKLLAKRQESVNVIAAAYCVTAMPTSSTIRHYLLVSADSALQLYLPCAITKSKVGRFRDSKPPINAQYKLQSGIKPHLKKSKRISE